MRLALYEPDIPQNTGALMRLCACLGVPLDIVEPMGFQLTDRALKRAGLDYTDRAQVTVHRSFAAFRPVLRGRLVLLSTKADLPYTDFRFASADTLLLGRESAGVPEAVHQAADSRLLIPMTDGLRSINVALAGAMVLGEALRQTRSFPDITKSCVIAP